MESHACFVSLQDKKNLLTTYLLGTVCTYVSLKILPIYLGTYCLYATRFLRHHVPA